MWSGAYENIKCVYLGTYQILMTVIPTHVRTMEHVLTVRTTTCALAYLDFKERTAPLVKI